MESLNEIFPVIIYTLSSILLVSIIVLVIKLIKTVDKTNLLLDDIEEKSRSLDGLFCAIDSITDTIATINEKVVDSLSNLISKIFRRKKRKEDEEDE